ncbi:MAG: hypothetical protein KDE20_12090 [Caldilineaceae bacterium]|jgi:hypothetical protein|nr:hypothetical protein [Caldilineaceae bacterium]
MANRTIFKSVLSAIVAGGLVLPAATPAQDNDDANADLRSNAVCMLRPFGDVPQVPVARRGQPFRILTIERAASGLEAKGFTRVDCTVADLVLAGKRAGWRDEICELASKGNEAVQNQLERAYGERPAVLCAMAEAVAGQWERPGRGSGE